MAEFSLALSDRVTELSREVQFLSLNSFVLSKGEHHLREITCLPGGTLQGDQAVGVTIAGGLGETELDHGVFRQGEFSRIRA